MSTQPTRVYGLVATVLWGVCAVPLAASAEPPMPRDIEAIIADLNAFVLGDVVNAAEEIRHVPPAQRTRAVKALTDALKRRVDREIADDEERRRRPRNENNWYIIPGPIEVITKSLKELSPASVKAQVPLLLSLLKIPTPVAYDGIQGLIVAGRDAEPTLFTLLLKSDDEELLSSVAVAMGGIAAKDGDTIIGLTALSNNSRPLTRKYAIKALGDAGHSGRSVESILLARLDDPEPDIRASVCAALEDTGSRSAEVVRGLTTASQDAEAEVREAACVALGSIGTDDCLAALRAVLRGEELETVFAAAAFGLARRYDAEAVVALRKVVHFEETTSRFEAIRWLGELREPAAVEVLISLFDHDHPTVRQGAVSAVGEAGEVAEPAVDFLLSALRDRDSSVRRAAALSLGKIGARPESVVPVLIDTLSDKHPRIRSAATRALGQFEARAKSAVTSLTKALTDPEEGVRREALGALIMIGQAGVPAIRSVLASNELRTIAIRGLGEIGAGATESIPQLLELLNDPSECQDVITTLGRVAPHSADVTPVVRRLEALLSDEDGNIVGTAAESLGRFGDRARPAVATLIRSLNSKRTYDPSFEEPIPIRVAFIKALGEIGPAASDALPALARLLVAHDDERTVVWCRAAQVRIAPDSRVATEAFAALVGLLNTPSYEAAEALGAIANEASIAALEKAFRDPRFADNSGFRSWIADALGTIGPAAAMAVPSLREALRSDNRDVWSDSAWALGQIGQAAKVALPELEEMRRTAEWALRRDMAWRAIARIRASEDE